MMLKVKQLEVQKAKVTARKLEMECTIYEYQEKIKNLEKEIINQEDTINNLEQEIINIKG